MTLALRAVTLLAPGFASELTNKLLYAQRRRVGRKEARSSSYVRLVNDSAWHVFDSYLDHHVKAARSSRSVCCPGSCQTLRSLRRPFGTTRAVLPLFYFHPLCVSGGRDMT